MTCPKCRESFEYARWKHGEFVEQSEPWDCPNCGIKIVTDKEKGYGLKELSNE